MNNINYQKELEKILSDDNNKGKKLMLHSCCAPCSSYVLVYLSCFFDITVFYYNPNITLDTEYRHRVEEQIRLIEALNSEDRSNIPEWAFGYQNGRNHIKVLCGDYDVDNFYTIAKGLENEPEGGARCAKCFQIRLERTYEKAKELEMDYFGTTLTISPLKNAQLINSIGINIAGRCTSPLWLPSDFKKKEGYKHSIELSSKYDLYRQNFCGCIYSQNQ